jgi:hypothetical protein
LKVRNATISEKSASSPQSSTTGASTTHSFLWSSSDKALGRGVSRTAGRKAEEASGFAAQQGMSFEAQIRLAMFEGMAAGFVFSVGKFHWVCLKIGHPKIQHGQWDLPQ